MKSKHLQLPSGVQLDKTIPQYFSGKNVFITGATGFMGKVLVEKLLRSCPDVGTIYVLIRVYKDKSPQERWDKVTDDELFSKLNKIALKKVKVLQGDVTISNLGLSPEVREELVNNVSIIYHSAATVRFTETLQDATIKNVQGTKEVCKLALEAKKLEVFMHVSTAFCQFSSRILDEKLYPAVIDPDELMQISETMDPSILNVITHKFCEGFPNTYTFTKNVAETLVTKMCEGKIPTIIFRPTVVTPTMSDPFTGFVDNFNGPVGFVFAGTKGILQVIESDKHKELDYCPVDSSIQAMIKATWYKSFVKDLNISVFNSAKNNLFSFTMDYQSEQGAKIIEENDIWCKPVMPYGLYLTQSTFIFWCIVYLYQLIPAILVELVLRAFGKKPKIIKKLSKLVSTLVITSFFGKQNFKFNNEKFVELDDYLLESDEHDFANQMESIDKDHWLLSSYTNICKRIGEGDVKNNCKKYKRLKIIFKMFMIVRNAIFAMLLYTYILEPFYVRFCDYIVQL